MTVSDIRNNIVTAAKQYWGAKEGGAKHAEILSIYNSIEPLPRGYKVTSTDAWCAAYVSAMLHKSGADQAASKLYECSVPRMVAAAQSLGVWHSRSYVPQIADLVVYDWDYNTVGDHIGIVAKVNAGYIDVMEGNYSDMCKMRTLKQGNPVILGYITPNYNAIATNDCGCTCKCCKGG